MDIQASTEHDAMIAMRRRVVVASTLGNAFEWFDYAIFGMFAPIISKLFFPASNEVNSMLLTFATFAVAFAMRPHRQSQSCSRT